MWGHRIRPVRRNGLRQYSLQAVRSKENLEIQHLLSVYSSGRLLCSCCRRIAGWRPTSRRGQSACRRGSGRCPGSRLLPNCGTRMPSRLSGQSLRLPAGFWTSWRKSPRSRSAARSTAWRRHRRSNCRFSPSPVQDWRGWSRSGSSYWLYSRILP